MILTLLLSTGRLPRNGVKRTVTRATKWKEEGTTICSQRTTLPVSRGDQREIKPFQTMYFIRSY